MNFKNFSIAVLQHVIKILGSFLLLLSCVPHPVETKANEDINEIKSILLILADDWSYPHAGAYGDSIVRTPTFDTLAREGRAFS